MEGEKASVVSAMDVEKGGVVTGGTPRASGSARSFGVAFDKVRWTPQSSGGCPCVRGKKPREWILSSITGYFEPGTLTAIMGASGSGKSSLLDILAKRKTQGTVEGRIFYGENPLTTDFARRHVGYVEQSPSLIANLTAEEMLLYTAALQRPAGEDPAWQKSEIHKLMDRLGLLGRKDVIVGDALAKGLSGGETKRVTIALGMIREPAVLYLDEPTSGLDSATANEIMKLVKDIADDDRTVATSIHSPTAFCFGLFDNLFLLASGRVAFFGRAAEAEEFLGTVGAARDLSYTTSEWLVELLAQPSSLAKITDGYEKSGLARENDEKVRRLQNMESPESGGAAAGGRRRRPVAETKKSFFQEVRALVKFRTPRNYTDGAYLGSRIGDKILFMLVIVSLYWGKGKPEGGASYASSMQVLPSVLFMVVVLPAFGAAGYMPSLMMERPIFVRERADGNYKVISYLLYKVVEEFVVTVPVSLLFCVVIYYGVGMHGSLALFWLIFLVTQNIGIVLAYLVAAFSPSVDSANAFLPCYVTLCLFFVGLLIPYGEIPVYWSWFTYITFLRYSWTALMMNEFQGRDIPFDVLGLFSIPSDESKWAYFGYTCIFYPVFFLGAYLIMSFRKYVKR
ncbi:ATP-binding cassette transporter [Chloropicon primus]|uniref:ATP-binding cassette transporter n=2 Tax=Chloropicon primus TaxID=1764295 RepID=A0A5B8MIE5_9CHLO|nr:ATP-binding cassette transporter [Chloropicon primus]UPQ99273.1 ATP-binding cassette transporter [Chloropicon primus]|eukprot:QDZ20061.1 ATP-binding cassette transporter [Chloropicon primus]